MKFLCVFILVFALFVVALVGANSTASADEYGDRFYSKTPSGMMPYTMSGPDYNRIVLEERSKELEDIATAAGDSDDDISPKTLEDPSQETPSVNK